MNKTRLMQVIDKIHDIAAMLSRDVNSIADTALQYRSDVATDKPTDFESAYIDGKFVDVERDYESLSEYFKELWCLKEIKDDRKER